MWGSFTCHGQGHNVLVWARLKVFKADVNTRQTDMGSQVFSTKDGRTIQAEQLVLGHDSDPLPPSERSDTGGTQPVSKITLAGRNNPSITAWKKTQRLLHCAYRWAVGRENDVPNRSLFTRRHVYVLFSIEAILERSTIFGPVPASTVFSSNGNVLVIREERARVV